VGDYEGHPVIFFGTGKVGYTAEIGARAVLVDEQSPIVANRAGFWVKSN
jgi:hypothetical protein